MRQLRPGLWAMDSSSSWGCNAFLITTDDRVILVDPGPKFQSKRLVRELQAAGRSPNAVTDVLLTHYDPDHARSAAYWRRRTGAKVWMGAEDGDVLRTRRAPGTRLRRFMMWLLRLPELPEGTVELRGETTIAPGLTALPTPGHTPGHYAFLWQDVALVGDAALTGPDGELVPFRIKPMMTDLNQSETTRRMLSELSVRLFCPGHSPAVERSHP